jgi:hypothetical protein
LTGNSWFDTSKFALLPSFTRRTNPLQFDSLTGPRYVNIDTTLAKEFPLAERLKFELRVEAYNLMNSFTGDEAAHAGSMRSQECLLPNEPAAVLNLAAKETGPLPKYALIPQTVRFLAALRR